MIKRQQAWILMNVLFMVLYAAFVCQAANSNDEKRQWTEVKRWSGNGMKSTETFTVGNEWRIRWSNRGKVLSVIVFHPGGSIPVDVPVNTMAQESNISYVYEGGKFYLKIIASGEWEIIVEEPVSDGKVISGQQEVIPIVNTPTVTASTTTPAAAQSSTPQIQIESPKAFFESFMQNSIAPPKSEFETQDEYQKRLPQAFDSTKVVYIGVLNGAGEKSYTYDIDTEKLTAFAGHHYKKSWGWLNKPRRYPGADKGTPIVVYNEAEYEGITYEATVAVKNYLVRDYVLNFSNLDLFPSDIYDSREGKFRISIIRSPKVAEQLSKNLEVIVGVRLPGYTQSCSVCTNVPPITFDNPTATAWFLYQIDAELVKVILREKSSQEVLAQYEIKPKVSGTPK